MISDRFLKPIGIIEDLIRTYGQEVNLLYKSDIRTPLFMVEGLARVYKNISNRKSFSKILVQAKELEDAIGVYDFTYVNYQDYKRMRLPSDIVMLAREKCIESEKALIKVLRKKGWLNERRLKKWRKRLAKIDWKDHFEDRNAVTRVFLSEIQKVQSFIVGLPEILTDTENELHELRRKLRWMSIYVQATRGLFILKPDESRKSLLEAYHTEKVIHSPYVNMNTYKRDHDSNIVLSEPDFIALSWMIDTLGSLKDIGLTHYEVRLLMEELGYGEKAQRDVLRMMSEGDVVSEKDLLSETKLIIDDWMRYNVLDYLLVEPVIES